ncbi:MAG: PAS domain S-box-containing protein [bacterium]|jgi:PAS domain S-box-containing protein
MGALILVVDDEPDLEFLILRKFKEKIQQEGIEFIFAQNGKQALTMLQENLDVDLVLTDLNMPEMDGLTLLSEIKKLDYTLETVVISAYDDMSNIRTAMNHGAFDFITKPLNFDDMEATIDKSLVTVHQLKKAQQSVKEAESALKESEARYRFLVDHLPDGLVVLSEDNHVVALINPSGAKILGEQSVSHVVGKKITTYWKKEEQSVILDKLKEVAKTGVNGHIPQSNWIRKDDSEIIVNLRIIPFPYEEKILKILIFSDITQLKKTEEKLKNEEIARLALEKVNTLKEEFLGFMVHELRTPLNTILANANLLELSLDDSSFLEEEGMTYIDLFQRIRKGGDTLLQLIQTMLDIQRLESGNLQMKFSKVNILLQIEDLIRGFTAWVNQKGLYIKFENHCESPCTVVIDEVHFIQVLRNLIGNAVKFTKAGGIVLSLNSEGENLVFSIQDTGCGIPEQHQWKIFDRFEQVSRKKIEQQGAGLGLTYCKHIINLHYGEIKVDSNLSQGSTFFVSIPKNITPNIVDYYE